MLNVIKKFLIMDNTDVGRRYVDELKRDKRMQEKTKNGKFPMLRRLAIVQSFVLIAIAIIGIVSCTKSNLDTTDETIAISVLSIFIAGQVFNIIAHWIDPSYQTKSWLGLYVIRKKLEEKSKIDALSNKKETNA